MKSRQNAPERMLEIEKIPRTYLSALTQTTRSQSKEAGPKNHSVQFERYLAALMFADVPVTFRLQSLCGSVRLDYTTPRVDSGLSAVESAFQAQFPDFQTTRVLTAVPTVTSPCALAVITGVPVRTDEALNGLARVLTKYRGSAVYQVSAQPVRVDILSRYLAKQRYRSALERSERQETSPGLLARQENRRRINVDAMERSRVHEATYRRLMSDRVLRCQVVLVLWGSQDAGSVLRDAVNTLLSTISSVNKKQRMRIRYSEGEEALRTIQRVLDCSARLRATLLMPSEAAPLFQVPSIELGLVSSSPASFTTAEAVVAVPGSQDVPFEPGRVVLGHAYREDSPDPRYLKSFSLDSLRGHVTIVGKTGTGKSTSKNRVIIDAWKNGVPSLLIEPVKTDARILLGAIPEMRLFTVGQENVAPWRDNPFLLEAGVPVQPHVSLLYSCLVAAWPLYGMLSNHTRRVLEDTYTHSGWDMLDDIQGNPIILDVFRGEVESYCDDVLQYGSELSQDFRGALTARAEDLCSPARAAIFNTTANLPVSELLSRPTVIELEPLTDPEFKVFVLSLLLVRVYEHFRRLGPSKKLRALLVVDEAHRVLEELPKTLDMSEHAMARRQVVDQFVNMIAESRTYGLGVVLCEQIPTRLARDAIKNSHTKIVHQLTSPDDIELMAAETNCDAEQTAHIATLRIGEAVVADPSSIVPSKVRIIHDPDYCADMNRVWTDDAVREHMQQFYDQHPDFAARPVIPDLGRHVGTSVAHHESAKTVLAQIAEIVHTEAFRELYEEAVTDCVEDSTSTMPEDLIAHYASHLSYVRAKPTEIAVALLEFASAAYGPLPREADFGRIVGLVDVTESGISKNVGGGRDAA